MNKVEVYCDECGQMVPADVDGNPLPHECIDSFDEDQLKLQELRFE